MKVGWTHYFHKLFPRTFFFFEVFPAKKTIKDFRFATNFGKHFFFSVHIDKSQALKKVFKFKIQFRFICNVNMKMFFRSQLDPKRSQKKQR